MKRMCSKIFPFLFLVAACGPQLLPSGVDLTLHEEQGEELNAVPAVVRFRLTGASGLDVADIWLVSGDVSSVSQGKLQRGEIPQTVEEHREPLMAWVEEGEVVLAPTRVLELGESYSFVALGVGLIGGFAVSSEERPILRLWGSPLAVEGGQAVYCLGAPPLLKVPGKLDAFENVSGFERGLRPGSSSSPDAIGGEEFCVRAQLPSGEEFYLPPPSVDEFLIEPTPIDFWEREGSIVPDLSASGCKDLAGFRGGCAEVDGGALLLRVSPGYYYFALFPRDEPDDALQLVVHATEEEAHALGPLAAETSYQLVVTGFVPGEAALPSEGELLSFESGPSAPRFVLTEVLADPLGSEPEGEWVEVMNIGEAEGSLGELELWDSGGGVVLPDVILQPGELGLIVRDDFSFESDEVPDAKCVPIVVPTLGDNGLRNSGEQVSLRTSDGRTLSSIPAISSGPGESVARSEPWSSDLPGSFESRRPPNPGAF